MFMNYSIVFYTTLAPLSIIFQGLATVSGVGAVVSMSTMNEPELKYKYLDVLATEGQVYISPSDALPYQVSIHKILKDV